MTYLLAETGYWHVRSTTSPSIREACCGDIVTPLVRSTTNRAAVNRKWLCKKCKKEAPAA